MVGDNFVFEGLKVITSRVGCGAGYGNDPG
jgi:hypothetical protein